MEVFKTRKKVKPRILFDMDDVLVEYIESVIEDYNKDFGTNYTIKDCTEWELKKIFGDKILYYLNTEGRFRYLDIKKNADKVMKEIIDTNRYDVFIVTACKPSAFEEKVEWLKEFMPFFDTRRIIPAIEKTAVWGDILIDDKIENLEQFEELIGKGIVFDMPHNQHSNQFERIYNLEELLPILDNIFYPNLNSKENIEYCI